MDGLPAGHGLPKWALPAALGGVALLFLLRAKGAASASPQAAQDPLQQAARALQIGNAQAANARSQALATQKFQEMYQTEQVSFFTNLIKNPVVACPGGGLPRLIPTGSGLAYGCVQHTSGGVTLKSLIDTTKQAIGLSKSV